MIFKGLAPLNNITKNNCMCRCWCFRWN